jgi:hypothetical protein
MSIDDGNRIHTWIHSQHSLIHHSLRHASGGADSPLLGFPDVHLHTGITDPTTLDPLYFPSPEYVRDLPCEVDEEEEERQIALDFLTDIHEDEDYTVRCQYLRDKVRNPSLNPCGR